jgi:dolichyl-phosphate-mannose-protein mannosyltransferase
MRRVQRRYLVLAAIVALALGLCCVYLSSNTSGLVDQSGSHGVVAHDILAGHWFTVTPTQLDRVGEEVALLHKVPDPADEKTTVPAGTHWKPFISEVPGPGLALAAVWAVSGSERYIYGKLLLIAIDLGMVLLVYRVASLLFGRPRAALIAAGLYAVCFPIARQTSIFDPDIWGLYFTLAIFDLYLEALRSQAYRWRWLLACGLLTGVGAFFRPNVLLLAPALGLATAGWPGVKWLWPGMRRPRPGLRRPWPGVRRPLLDAGVVLAVSAVVLMPWTIRNEIDFHSFVPIRSGSGVVLWEGLGELHNSFGAKVDDAATALQFHRERPDLEANSPAYDQYLRTRAIHTIEQHPLYYAKLVGRRMLLTTIALYESAWMYHGGESPFLYHTRTGGGLLSFVVHRPLPLLESAFEPAIFVLAMLVFVFTWRRYRREHRLLIGLLLSALIPYWLLHVEARYVLPTLPVYLILVALGAELVGERVLQRLRRGLRPAPAPLAPPDPARSR